MPPSDVDIDHSPVRSAIETASSKAVTPTVSAFYSRFAVPLTVAVFSLAAMVLPLGDNLGRHRFSSVVFVASFAVVTIFSLLIAWRERARLRSSVQMSPEVSTNIRKLQKIALIFAVLFSASTFLIGYYAGVSGSETEKFMFNLGRRQELGRRISQIRQGADEGIPAQLQMYKTLSSEVEELDALIRQLRTEFAVYEAKYQMKDDEKKQIIESFDTDTAWLAILKKEIAVAKHIQTMDDPARSERWVTEMVPLRFQEQAITGTR